MFNIPPYNCAKSSQEIKQWYEKNYHSLALNGLWLKGGEFNTMDTAFFPQAELRFLICRLSDLTGNQTVVRKKLPFTLTEWAVVKRGRVQYHGHSLLSSGRAAIPDLPVIYIP